ncbi:MAG: amidohydrolase family protein, partial [Clostridia bacterium]|nr:amidohydrolase family protein [Clostridia bacterium]
ESKLDFIAQSGLKGIKLHPDYQGVFLDDERYVRIIQGAVDRDLCVVIHAGIDIGLDDPVHASPARSATMLGKLTLPASPRIILAHMGGWRQWDDVEALLVGLPIYFDLSFSLPYIDEAQLMRIIRRHGADRILFASDSPWGDQSVVKSQFDALPLTESERRLIVYDNAARLLNL